jgi:hypothetical protein
VPAGARASIPNNGGNTDPLTFLLYRLQDKALYQLSYAGTMAEFTGAFSRSRPHTDVSSWAVFMSLLGQRRLQGLLRQPALLSWRLVRDLAFAFCHPGGSRA